MTQPLDDAALDQLFREGRTYNGYLNRSVSRDQLEAIWELMKMGPTSANCLPARLVWCDTDAAKQKLAACAMPSNGEKILKAPVSVVVGMDIDFHEQLPWLFPHDQTAKHWFGDEKGREIAALRNSSLQGGYFILAARALGLDTGPMSGFNHAAVDAAFFAGTTIKSNFISTLGYGDPATIFERSPRPDFNRFNSFA